MTEKRCLVRCYHCGGDTEIKLQVPESTGAVAAASNQTIQKKVYCDFCNRLNIIDIPSTWDSHPLVLGDEDFLGYSRGIPIVQGKKP